MGCGLQKKRKKTGHKSDKKHKLEHEHLLSGILKCPVCGANLYGNVNRIHCMTIVGQIEGHYVLPSETKATKYEHMIPQLVAVDESTEIEGLLLILNTVGGDIEAGLALAELIAGMKKPTVSLVLGGGHSIGIPLAVAAKTSFIVPSVILFILLYGLGKGVDLYAALTSGMKAGLRVCADIFPAVLTMLVAVTMVRASGAIDLLSAFLSPLLELVGMPAECLPLALLRPFSGSGALSVGSEVMARTGPDSLAGRVAAVMLGSSDTSFYTIAVYSAYLGLKDTRYTLKAALCADLAAFVMSGLAVRLLMG